MHVSRSAIAPHEGLDAQLTLTVLHDPRVLLGGGGRPGEASVDGMLGMLTTDGQPDTRLVILPL